MKNEIKIIKHKFRTHRVNPLTEILIIGTFNPDVADKNLDFFYGRPRNFLWTLLPKAFKYKNLKHVSKLEKLHFMNENKIDFIDIISEIKVLDEKNYYDTYLEKRVTEWNDVISQISNLKNLKKVCFTRKSFASIPQIKKRVDAIQTFCYSQNIEFCCLVTPARFIRKDKQDEWNNFFKI